MTKKTTDAVKILAHMSGKDPGALVLNLARQVGTGYTDPMKFRAALLVFVLFFSGCVTGEKMGDIRPGMSATQVEKVLGRPDAYEKSGQQEAYGYVNRLMSGWSWDRADYAFLFEDGKLVKYGPGNVSHRESPMGTTSTLLIVWR